MKLRLITALIAAAALSGCATYDYAGGNAPGGYYYGRSTPSYGPYYDGYGYGYPSYGYGGYGGYGYGYGGYGGYYPYYLYRPVRPHRPDHDHEPDPGSDRAPPWRSPVDGRYRESGRVKIPPQNRLPQSPGQPRITGDGRQSDGNAGIRQRPTSEPPRRVAEPSPPRSVERPRAVERAAPPPRSENRGRVRNDEP
jgi:hypothetical protein